MAKLLEAAKIVLEEDIIPSLPSRETLECPTGRRSAINRSEYNISTLVKAGGE